MYSRPVALKKVFQKYGKNIEAYQFEEVMKSARETGYSPMDTTMYHQILNPDGRSSVPKEHFNINGPIVDVEKMGNQGVTIGAEILDGIGNAIESGLEYIHEQGSCCEGQIQEAYGDVNEYYKNY